MCLLSQEAHPAALEPRVAQPNLPWPRMWLMKPRCLSLPSPTAAGILAGSAMSLLLALQHLHGKNTPAASCSQVGSWEGGMWGIPAVTPQLCPAPLVVLPPSQFLQGQVCPQIWALGDRKAGLLCCPVRNTLLPLPAVKAQNMATLYLCVWGGALGIKDGV